jgi:hypothetical protein
MKTSLKNTALAAAAFCSFAPLFAQTTATTPVVGFYKMNLNQGRSLLVSGFITKNDFQGQASSFTSTTASSVISQSNPGWTTNAFNLHYVEILDGPQAGLILDIISNTASSVTVEGNLGANGFNVSQTVKYAIRKHATLGGLFKGAGLQEFEDVITIYTDTGARKTFFFDNTNPPGQIVASDQVTNRDNEIIYPGQGMFINCVTPRVLTLGGNEVSYIKETPTKVPLYANKINITGLINPLVNNQAYGTGVLTNEKQDVSSIGLGLINSSLAEYEDTISIYSVVNNQLTRSSILFYDQEQNKIVNASGSVSTVTISNGTAMIIRPIADRYYNQPGVSISN